MQSKRGRESVVRRREAAEYKRKGEPCEEEGSGRARGGDSLLRRREAAEQ